jgi:hypothetical protein
MSEENSQLALRILRTAFEHRESWREHHFGTHLAYLVFAILEGGDAFVDWSDDLADAELVEVRTVFQELFPAADPVWTFIRG